VFVGEADKPAEHPELVEGAPQVAQDLQASEAVEVAVVETNIDDLSPQVYDVVMERLFDAGALDVYLTPIQMKKSRPATLLSVICEHGAVKKLSGIIFEETTSIGVRIARLPAATETSSTSSRNTRIARPRRRSIAHPSSA